MMPSDGRERLGRRLSESGLPCDDVHATRWSHSSEFNISLPAPSGDLSVLNFVGSHDLRHSLKASQRAGDKELRRLEVLTANHSGGAPAEQRNDKQQGRSAAGLGMPRRLPTFQQARSRTVLQRLGMGRTGANSRRLLRELNLSGRIQQSRAAVAITTTFKAITTNPIFEGTALALICANCVTLALHNPLLPEDDGINATLGKIDIVFNFIFTVEMLMRVLALGGIFPYLSSSWNCFDFVMVLAGYTQFIPSGSTAGAGGLRALRAVRALRPLRTITRFSSLRAVVVCFLEAVPLLMSLVVFLLFMFFLFAIAGMVLFQEAYHGACINDTTGAVEGAGPDATGEFSCGIRKCPTGFSCTFQEYVDAPTPGFDNIALAMLTVFQCTTISGWSYVMYRVQDTVHPLVAVYFIALILINSYFVINLFLAVLKLKFGKAQRMLTCGDEEATQQQTLRLMLKRLMKVPSQTLAKSIRSLKTLRRMLTLPSALNSRRLLRMEPLHSDTSQPRGSLLFPASVTGQLSKALKALAHMNGSKVFRHSILGLIVLSTLALAVEYDGMPAAQEQVLHIINLGVTCAFTVEVLIGVLAEGWGVYWRDRSKLLDLIIVLVSIADLVISASAAGAQSDHTAVRVLKSLRVMRVLKLFKYIESLVKIAEVLEASMGSFVAVGVLALIFMIVFAIVGLHIFGGAIPPDEFPNFNSFFNSFLTMFQVLTLEDWEIIMTDLVTATNWWAALYLLAWILIGHFIVLTLFLAVILEAFESMYDVTTGKDLIIAEIGARKSAMPSTHSSVHQELTASIEGSSLDSEYFAQYVSRRQSQERIPDERADPQQNRIGGHIGTSSCSPEESPGQADQPFGPSSMVRSGFLKPSGSPEATGNDVSLEIHVQSLAQPNAAQPLGEGTESGALIPAHRSAFRNAVIDSILSGNSCIANPKTAAAEDTDSDWKFKRRSDRLSLVPRFPPQGTRPRQSDCSQGDVLSLEDSLAGSSACYPQGGWAKSHTKELYRSIVWDQPGMAAIFARRSAVGSTVRLSGPVAARSSDVRGKPDASHPEGRDFSSETEGRPRARSTARTGSSATTGTEKPRQSAQALWQKARVAEQVLQRVRMPARFAGAAMEGPPHGVHRAPVPKFVPPSVSVAAAHYEGPARLPGYIPDFTAAAALALPEAAVDEHNALVSRRVAARRASVEPAAARRALIAPMEPLQVAPRRESDVDKRLQSVQREAAAYKQLLEKAEFGRNALDVVVHPRLRDGDAAGGSESGDGAGHGGGSHGHGGDVPELAGKSFGLFPANLWLRQRVYAIVSHQRFDNLILLCIFLSCCAMVYEHPQLQPGALDTQLLNWLDVGLTAVFGAECLMKMFAYCVRQYLKDNSNKLDCFIVCTSVLLIAAESGAEGLQAIKAFRVLRALKPLRTLTHSAGMLLVLKSVTLSVAAMANVSLLMLLVFVIFGVMGMQLFSGLLYSCSDGSFVSKQECTGTYVDMQGATLQRSWTNYALNFDNLGSAFLAMFVTVSLDGYAGLLVQAVSAPSTKDEAPKFMHSPLAAMYFLAFITVCAFCLLNLYVGVVFFQFSRIRLLAQTGAVFMSEEQQQWVEMAKMTFRTRPREIPPPQSSPLRAWARRVSMSKRFEIAVLSVVVANVIIMALNTYGQSRTKTRVFERINLVFSLVFIVEAIIKISGFGWRFYIRSGWNKFDFVLVAASVIDFVMSAVGSSVGGSIFSILRSQKLLRVTRITRMLKLIKSFKSLQSLFVTLWISLPAFWNVGALLLLIMFVYSYLGVQLLGGLRHGDSINEHANFDRFWMAMLTLFRVATNDEWLGIMLDAMDRTDCNEEGVGNCGTWVAAPYFVSYIIAVSIIMLNLFTAVIIENFEKQQQSENWVLQPGVLEDLAEVWAEFDDGSGTIENEAFELFLKRLGPPLGLRAHATNAEVFRLAAQLQVPLVNGRLPFTRTTYELVRVHMEQELPRGDIREQLHHLIDRHFAGQEGDPTGMSASHSLTVLRLQQRWKLRMRVAKVARRKAFIAAHSAAACPTYTALLSHRVDLAQQICELAARPPTKVQLWSTTAGSSLSGAQYAFGVEVDGAPSGGGARAGGRPPGLRSYAAEWRARVGARGGSPPRRLSNTGPVQAAGSVLTSAMLAAGIKRFAWGGRRANTRPQQPAEAARGEDT